LPWHLHGGGVERTARLVRQHDEVAICLHAGGQCPGDGGRVGRVHVLIHDDDVLQRCVPTERRFDGSAAVLRALFLNLHDGVKPEAASHRHGHVRAGAHGADGLIDSRLPGQAHQQPVFEAARQQRLVQGILPVRNSVDHQDRLGPHDVPRACQVQEGPLWGEIMRQPPLQNDLRLGRHTKIRAEGTYHGSRSKSAGDGQLIDARGRRHRCCQLHLQRRTYTHGDGQVSTGPLPGTVRAPALYEARDKSLRSEAHEPVKGHIRTRFGIADAHDGRGDISPAVAGQVGQDRQALEIDLLLDAFLAGRAGHLVQRLRAPESPHQVREEVGLLRSEGESDVAARGKQTGHDAR